MQLVNPTLQGSGTNRYTQIQLSCPRKPQEPHEPKEPEEPKCTSSKAAAKKVSKPTWLDEDLIDPPIWHTAASSSSAPAAAAASSSSAPAAAEEYVEVVEEEEDMEEVKVEEEPWDWEEVKEEEVEAEAKVKQEAYPWYGKQGSAREAWAAARSGWRKKRGGANAAYYSSRLHVQHSEFHSWYARPENRS
eukprot:s1343_g6.t1